MKFRPLHLILILGMVSIGGALVTQFHWLNKALRVKEANFDQAVILSLRRVSERMQAASNYQVTPLDAVQKISQRRFQILIDNTLDANVLDFYLRTELAYPSLHIDFEYTVQDQRSGQVIFTQHVAMSDEARMYSMSSSLPKWGPGSYLVNIYFPKRAEFIGVKMTIWIFSSVVLLIVVFFFAYTIFVILQQMRLLKMQKDFIDNLAHEFKTPLATIDLSAQTLLQPDIVNDPERLTTYARIIEEECQRMSHQAEQLLTIAQLEKSQVQLKSERIDLHELIANICSKARLRLYFGNGQIICQLNAKHFHVMADRVHLTNALNTLVDNALKYALENPMVEVITHNEGNQILVTVRDNGIGIPKQYHKKIFEKFYRVPTGNVHNAKGFGVGLHYLKMVADAHHWRVSVSSTPGKGSAFTLSIPFLTPELSYETVQSPNLAGGR